MPFLFSYGTLKKDFSNQPLLDDQKFLGKAVTSEANFLLYECHGNYTFPALVQSKTGEGYQVYGELYDVTEKCLTYLDRIEGVGIGLYARTLIKVVDEHNQLHDDVVAYCFLRSVVDLKPIGRVWPISELSRYRMVGHHFEEEEKEIEFDGVALYNKHMDRFATPAFESEELLKGYCLPKRTRYGVPTASLASWDSKWFESRPRKGTKAIVVCRLRTGDAVSPDFETRGELASWASDELTFFGGEEGSGGQWVEVLGEVAPRIDED